MPPRTPTRLEPLLLAFERRLGATLTLHDYDGILGELLPKFRFSHDRIPFCQKVKRARHLACAAFDLKTLQQSVDRYPDGGIKVCGAGVVEVFHPIAGADHVFGMLFLGPFRPGSAKSMADLTDRSRHRGVPAEGMEPMTAELKADLLLMAGAIARTVVAHLEASGLGEPGAADRKTLIDRFVRKNYRRDLSLAEVAALLGTGLSRASEIVTTLFGMGFPDLVLKHRLDRATRQLTCTAWPVHFVARECGFENTPYFNRVFKARTGMTPVAWRRTHAEPTDASAT